jgi:hypothetical protein
MPVDREQVFKLREFVGRYRMSRGREHGQYVPNSRFVFVTTTTGETLMHQRFRHPSLSEGKPVLYAGEAYFNNGNLEWWSNGSGNYRPDPAHATQAGLPMDHFYPYDAVLKGLHTKPPAERGAESSVAQGKTAVGIMQARTQGIGRPVSPLGRAKTSTLRPNFRIAMGN